MPFCCASTAALLALSRPAPAGKPRKEVSLLELEHALASAKAGELQVAQLEVALAAATRRSEVVARRVVGLEVELEGASRLLNALEEDEAYQEEEDTGHATDTQEESAPIATEQIAVQSDKSEAVPLGSTLAGVRQAKRFSLWGFACLSRSDEGQ